MVVVVLDAFVQGVSKGGGMNQMMEQGEEEVVGGVVDQQNDEQLQWRWEGF